MCSSHFVVKKRRKKKPGERIPSLAVTTTFAFKFNLSSIFKSLKIKYLNGSKE